MSVEQKSEERAALDRLVAELRTESAPTLDWDRMEARLLRERQSDAPSASQRVLGRLRVPAMVLIAVAALTLVLAKRRAPNAGLAAPAGKALTRLARGPLDGDELALGTRVTAGNESIVVEHAGRARWTLEPHATAFVSDAGEFLTIRLESGALSAAVVPNRKPETFAVEAGHTRIAVHGTAFRVERTGDRVLVQVSEGTVAVEPAQTHSDPFFLLRRDSRGNFGLDGQSGSVEGNAAVVLRDTRGQSRRELTPSNEAPSDAARLAPAQGAGGPAPSTTGSTTPVSKRAAEQLPVQPSISDIENGVTSAIALLNGCFRSKTQSANNRVSVSTGMNLRVAPDGSVQSVTFSPPLGPTIEDCAVIGLRQLTFARSVEGVSFTRILELTR